MEKGKGGFKCQLSHFLCLYCTDDPAAGLPLPQQRNVLVRNQQYIPSITRGTLVILVSGSGFSKSSRAGPFTGQAVREFPGGLVARTPHSHYEFNPWSKN